MQGLIVLKPKQSTKIASMFLKSHLKTKTLPKIQYKGWITEQQFWKQVPSDLVEAKMLLADSLYTWKHYNPTNQYNGTHKLEITFIIIVIMIS